MASLVFNGNLNAPSTPFTPSAFSYTNNSGQNVRIILNYVSYIIGASSGSIRITIDGSSVALIANNTAGNRVGAFGKNIAYSSDILGTMQNFVSQLTGDFYMPTEIFISNSQTFELRVISDSSATYNIVIIPEAG